MAASQVYFEGEFWECIADAAPGESPTSAPEKWQRLDIPAIFERFLVQSSLEKLLPDLGQNDKRRGERLTAADILSDTVLREIPQSGSGHAARSTVHSR